MSKRNHRSAFEEPHPPSHAPYALIGTPLPPLDSNTRDDGSYVPPWQQEVLDDRGRKRLHGAFTGGWSAGYFNTVGSKEGWTPATFTSSRNKQNAKGGESKAQRVEDFMDEEDLREREEGQGVETLDSFAGLGGGKVKDGDSGGGMFGSLFRVSGGDTIGVRLLQKMGWKIGQGIGPKVRRRARGDKSGETHLFAPEDSRVVEMSGKRDRKGLGFAGEERLEKGDGGARGEDDDESERDARILKTNRSKVVVQPKQKLKKSGFGVGILNDTGSDEDEDAYDMGPKISYTRIIGGDKKSKKKKAGLVSTTANPAVQKPTFVPSKTLAQRQSSLAGFRKCHDGRLPLEGFALITAPLVILQENKYPPPHVPDGWKPSRLTHPTSTTTITYQSTADAAKLSNLTPSTRATLLGESPLPSKSIFAYLTPSARDSIATATHNSSLPAALSEKAPAGFEASSAENQRKRLWELVPELDVETARAALGRGWMPYAEDDGKRGRYREFLAMKVEQGVGGVTLPARPKGMSVEEWGGELSEFAQAASVFRPVGGVMGRRFVSSSGNEGHVEKNNGLETDVGRKKEEASMREEDPAEKAAKLGMFGPLTRIRQVFAPTRLLCKRFNVRVPANVGEETQSGKTAGDGVGREDVGAGVKFKPAGFISAGTEGGDGNSVSSVPAKPQEVMETNPRLVDAERNEALEGQKAGEAVFKAIFGSDDEDDED